MFTLFLWRWYLLVNSVGFLSLGLFLVLVHYLVNLNAIFSDGTYRVTRSKTLSLTLLLVILWLISLFISQMIFIY